MLGFTVLPAFAITTWTDWTSATTGHPGSATGTLGGPYAGHPDAFIRSFSEGRYDLGKRLLSALVYAVFHLDLHRLGWQKVVLSSARKIP